MTSANRNVVVLSPGQEWSRTNVKARTARANDDARIRARHSAPADRDGVVALAAQAQRFADPLLVLAALALSAWLQRLPFSDTLVVLSVVAALLTLIFFKPLAFEQPWRRAGVLGMCTGVLGAWMMTSGTLLLLGAITGYLPLFPVELVLVWFVLVPLFLMGSHAAVRTLLRGYTRSPESQRRAVVVGVNETGARLARAMTEQPDLGLAFRGFFDDRGATRLESHAHSRLYGRIAEVPAFVARERIDAVYIALPMSQHQRILDLLDGLRDTTASIYFVPDIFVFDLIQGRVTDVDGLPVVAVCETPLTGIDGVVKRATDVALAGLALLLLSPLFGAIALAIKWGSAGPVLFKQRRYGIDGREIVVFKFRTMYVCEDGDCVLQARRADPRVTPLGSLLRRTSLDELPQLLNVLRGEMSLVGPRPHAVAHNEMYRKLIKGYMLRHKVRPGITGWAQVNGLRGETESVDKMQRRVEHDLDYLRHWSLSFDIKIMFMTLMVLLRDRHAY